MQYPYPERLRILFFYFLSKVKKKERTGYMEIASVKCVMTKDTLNIDIEGDVDHHTAKFIRSEIDKAIFYYRPKVALLNTSRVDFMDSSGLGLILGRVERAGALRSSVRVVGLSPTLMKLVRLAGIERVQNLTVTK